MLKSLPQSLKLRPLAHELARDRTLVTFIVGATLLAAAGLAAIATVFKSAVAERLVTHTLEVQSLAGHVFTNLVDAESGARGYIITGQEDFLQHFHTSMQAMSGNLASLQAKTADNPSQQALLKVIEERANTWFAKLEKTISLVKEARQNEAVDAVRTAHGNRIIDELRTRIDTVTANEQQLFDIRQLRWVHLQRWLFVFIVTCLAATGALSLYFIRSSRSYIAQVQAKNDDLEAEAKLRQATEDTLRQSQKMDAVGHLTGGIAHDFNNLLTIIMGNLDTIQRRIQNVDNAAAATLARPLDAALKGARSAAKLTHRLLAFSRQQSLEPVALDINSLVGGMSDLLRRTVGETIHIETVLAGGLWKTFADPNQLESVLVNLVVNARDALPAGGHITIETSNAFLDEAYVMRLGDVKAGQFVLLSVTDDGVGIPETLLDRLFEPFFTTKNIGEGTGLGLAMVHGFVKQSNGHVRIYSEEGHGTTVKVYLPRLTAAQETRAFPAVQPVELVESAQARNGETILLVEDNADVREYAVSVLEDLGYRVTEAANASEALAALSGAARFDLLFTDVVLPGQMNGRQLAERVSAFDDRIAALFTTGFTRNAIVHHGRLDAEVHLIHKPYTQQELARKVRELLDERRASFPEIKTQAS